MISTARRPGLRQRKQEPGDRFGTAGRGHFGEFSLFGTWAPAINLYQFRQRLDVCVDLAGVEPGSIRVRVEVGRLIIEGVRRAPQPAAGTKQAMCIVAMEIDHGPFCRTIPLSHRVERSTVQIHYVKGLLWIRLPLNEPEP